jgi:drug/metabolite transporter (DMT)-like permease
VKVRSLGLLGAAQLAVGAAAIFARLALTGTGPLCAAALRIGIAAVPVVILALAARAYRRIDGPTEARLAAGGIVLGAHFALWLTSLRHASVAVSTLLVCTTPIFAESWALARTGRRRPLTLGGILAAVAGVAIIVGAPSGRDTPLGIALALGGAVAFAAYLILVGASDARYSTLAVVARTYPVATIVLALAATLTHEPVPPASAHLAWAGILAMALLSQLFGHSAINAAVRTLSPTVVGMTILLEPAIAAVGAAVVFGERLTPATGIGALIILGGIALAVRAETAGSV